MDPVNTAGFQIGELSIPQYLFLMLVILQLTLLYAVGILPLEFDFRNGFFNDRGIPGSSGQFTIPPFNSRTPVNSNLSLSLKRL